MDKDEEDEGTRPGHWWPDRTGEVLPASAEYRRGATAEVCPRATNMEVILRAYRVLKIGLARLGLVVGSRAAVVEEEDEMEHRTKTDMCARVRKGTIGTGWALLALLAVLAVAVPSCNPFNNLGDAWANADATSAGAGGDRCADMGGGGGMGGGFGGNFGLGGSGVGGSGVGVGGDPSTASAAVGAGGGDPQPPPPGPPGIGGGGGGGGAASPGGTYQTGQTGPCEPAVISFFKSKNFPFVTIVADDGEGTAAGWQQTAPTLAFTNGYDEFYICHVTIGMPLRTTQRGVIAPTWAAATSADFANVAASMLWPPSVPQSEFCDQFRALLKKYFGEIEGLGARVTP